MSVRHAWLLGVSVAVAAPNVDAQRSAPPPWGVDYPTDLGDVTPAQRAAMMATIDEFERILRQVPELAQPRGFDIRKTAGGGPNLWKPDGVYPVGFGLRFYMPGSREGRMCIIINANIPVARPTELRS